VNEMDISIRTMTKNDFIFCKELSDMLGWGYTKEDFERLFSFEPNGCFIAEKDGKKIGMVTTIVYNKLAWTGWLVVLPEYRRKGIGTSIMRHAIDHLKEKGVETIRLEAGPISSLLYEKLGFKKELDISMFNSVGRKLESKNVRNMDEKDLEKIAGFDEQYFGADRGRVILGLYKSTPELCFVFEEESKITGYMIGMKNRFGIILGPWVCREINVAEEMLKEMLNNTLGKKLYIGVPAANKNCVYLLKKYDFKESGKMFRMYLGEHKYLGNINGIYGMGTSEMG